MPFKSKAQMKAAFGGYLGPEMKAKAKQWADETPNIGSLPYRKKKGQNHGLTKLEKRSIHGSGEFNPREVSDGYKQIEVISPWYESIPVLGVAFRGLRKQKERVEKGSPNTGQSKQEED